MPRKFCDEIQAECPPASAILRNELHSDPHTKKDESLRNVVMEVEKFSATIGSLRPVDSKSCLWPAGLMEWNYGFRDAVAQSIQGVKIWKVLLEEEYLLSFAKMVR